MTHPVIGETTPFMGDAFQVFSTATIHGLAFVKGKRIDILAVAAMNPGRGDFGLFLKDCMKSYQTIGIWEIWNGNLREMLRRRGFREVHEVIDADLVTGMRWDKAART